MTLPLHKKLRSAPEANKQRKLEAATAKIKAQRRAAVEKSHEDLISRTAGNYYITDHAIVRYLERVENIDIAALKEKILTAEILDIINKLNTLGSEPVRNGIFPINNEFSIVIKEKRVVTVQPNGLYIKK